MSGAKKTAFQALIEAVTAPDEKTIEDAATRVVRERIACRVIKPRKIRCKTN
jgi:hypothetical protein